MSARTPADPSNLISDELGSIGFQPAPNGSVDEPPTACVGKDRMPKTRKKTESFSNVRAALREALIARVSQFCSARLDDEYQQLCCIMAEEFCNMRQSPVMSGKIEGWAAGIVYSIGWVNFLTSPDSSPHVRSEDIAAGFSVSPATMMAKARIIRGIFGLIAMHPDWCVASKLEANPLVWMLSVNGMIVDIRHMPREVQEIAFDQGLIPYIPADHDVGIEDIEDEQSKSNKMKKSAKSNRDGRKDDAEREDRITMEIVVDAYNESERATAWYEYLSDRLKFPFGVRCIAKHAGSPLAVGSHADAIGLAPDEMCRHQIFIEVRGLFGRAIVPLATVEPTSGNSVTKTAVADWRYWMRKGYEF